MENSAKKAPENEVLMAKSPESAKDNDDDTKPDRTLQLVTTSVIVNKRITTPVTLKLRPTHGSYVAKAHRNNFIAMKMKDLPKTNLQRNSNRHQTTISRW